MILERELQDIRSQSENSKKVNQNFDNLPLEYSKLKEDFRILFSTSERLKHEYKNIQEQYP